MPQNLGTTIREPGNLKPSLNFLNLDLIFLASRNVQKQVFQLRLATKC
jgi:hypothetical protein